jgi:hypothetical protein
MINHKISVCILGKPYFVVINILLNAMKLFRNQAVLYWRKIRKEIKGMWLLKMGGKLLVYNESWYGSR